MSRFFKFTFILVLGWSSLLAQPVDKHSLAIGLKSGYAKPDLNNHVELYTAQIGINLNHQANVSNWFSWRTGFNASYLFPIAFRENLNTMIDPNLPGPFVVSQRTSYEYWLLNLDLMPTFYYRDDGFKLFCGLAGNLGANLSTIITTNEQFENGTGPHFEEVADHSDNYFQVGWGPAGGVGFDLGGKRKGGEIELSLSYKTFFDLHGGGYKKNMTVFGILTSYRYYFKH